MSLSNKKEITTSSSWPMSTTKIMLVKMKKYSKLLETREIKTKKNMWELISEEMAHSNFLYTSVQIENKWKGLCRKYRQTRDYNIKFKSFGDKKTSPFEKEVLEILNKRNKVFGESTQSTYSIDPTLQTKNTIMEQEIHLESPIKIEQFDVMEVENPLNINNTNNESSHYTEEDNQPKNETTLGDIKNLLENLIENIRETSERSFELKEEELSLRRETNEILKSILKVKNL